jgi:hypothetical protein
MLDHRLDRLRRYACATFARRGGQRERGPAHNMDTSTGILAHGHLLHAWQRECARRLLAHACAAGRKRTLPALFRSTQTRRSSVDQLCGLPWIDTDHGWLADLSGVKSRQASDSLSCCSARQLRTRGAADAERFGTSREVLVPPSLLLARHEASSPFIAAMTTRPRVAAAAAAAAASLSHYKN